MKHSFYQYTILMLWCLESTPVRAQHTVDQAWVEDNHLTVVFQNPIEVSDDKGFRLLGGAARIQDLVTGSGSSQLVFSLTDYVLPDDQFSLLYWSVLGDARVASEPLVDQLDISVTNRTDQYKGDGTIYYVSTAGNDNYYGTDSDHPLRTVNQAQRLAQAGDYILLERGSTFTNTFIDIKKSGRPGRYITFGAYGQGDKPVLEHDREDIVTISNQDYILIDNLHLKVKGNGEAGVRFIGNVSYPIVSNCRLEGLGRPHYGINYGENDGSGKVVVYPQLLNNYISGFRWNIRSSGYPYDGTHEVKGGMIENNICAATYEGGNDGISAQRGNYHGLIIRKNDVFGWYDDAIDLFAANNVVVEYNVLHSPQQPSSAGQGIKAGGVTDKSDKIEGHASTDIIVRYNTIYELYNKVNDSGSQNGIQTNDGAMGQIYGNVIHDVQGNGIVVSGAIEGWKVHHNIVANADKAGLNIWTEGSNDSRVEVYNNVLMGSQYDVKANTRTTKSIIVGKNNVLLHKKSAGAYQGQGDRQVDMSTLFVNPADHDFRLKPSYYQSLGTSSPEN